MKFRSIVFLCLIAAISILIFQTPVQAQSSTSFDYVILMDTSESMMWEGDPPIFEQLQGVVIAFIESLQVGSNVTLYSFDQEVRKIGAWTNVNDSKKMEIITTLSALKAEGQSTKLWDAVCDGVQDLKSQQRGLPGGNQFQMLVSFTDGIDNSSINEKETCVGNYIDLYDEEGHILWIYNAIGVEVPEIIRDNEGKIKIVEGNVPKPVRVTYLTPMTLRLGNLYETGKADSEVTCFVPWYSDNSMLNETISFERPFPAAGERMLPSFAFEVCGPGTSECPQEFKISEGRMCLEIALVAYKPELVKTEELGEYVYIMPVNLIKDLGESIFLVPEGIRLEFSLIPPTPVSPTTIPPTDTPTDTPTPTVTPTPVPPGLTCDGDSTIDLGVLPKPGAQDSTQASISCDLSWLSGEESDLFQLALLIDFVEGEIELTPGEEIWLDAGDGRAEYLNVDPETENVNFGVTLPAEIWEELGQKSTTFQGRILLVGEGQTIAEATSTEDSGVQVVEWKFSIKNPPPKWPWVIGGGLLVFLALWATRPRFPETAVLTMQAYGDTKLKSFEHKRWWSGRVYLGGGSRGYLKFEDEDEDLLAIRPSFQGSFIGRITGMEENTSYYLEPLSDAQVDVVGAQPISDGEEIEIFKQKFYLLYKNEKYELEITKVEEEGFRESGPEESNSEDLEGFFDI